MFLKSLVGTNLVLPPILNSLYFLKFGKPTQPTPTSNAAAEVIFSLSPQTQADCRDLGRDGFVKVDFQIKRNCSCTYEDSNELTSNVLKCVRVI